VGWIEDRINKGQAITAKNLYDKFGFRNVIGIHITGRTAIAGPMCVVALILRPTHKFKVIPTDQFSMAECYALNEKIRKKAEMLNMGWVSVSVLEKAGVQEGVMSAIRTVMAGVSEYNPPSIVLIDGFNMHPLPNGLRDSQCPVIVVKKGKEQVDVIAAASIVGKVARDSMMAWMHKEYPEYEWDQNGGFATTRHIELIKEHGISIYHRDLSNVKALKDFEAFPNKRWRENQYENRYFGE
jgi:ribonuclease HII